MQVLHRVRIDIVSATATRSMRDHGQVHTRAVRSVMVDADMPDAGRGGGHFRFAGLRISRKVREEGAGNLNADLMAGTKNLDGEHAVESHVVDLAGLEQFRFRPLIARAR